MLEKRRHVERLKRFEKRRRVKKLKRFEKRRRVKKLRLHLKLKRLAKIAADAEKAKLEAENKQLRAEAALAKAEAAKAAAETQAAADPVHRTLQQMAALQQHLPESPSGSQDLLKGIHELKLNPEQEGSLREWQMFERDMLRWLKEHAEFCVERNTRAFKQQHATVPAAQWQQDDFDKQCKTYRDTAAL